MDKVTQFEERRSRLWMTVFAVVLVLLLGVAVLFLFRTYAVLSEQHTLDVLEIIHEDKEIIFEFWQDTLSVMITELPQKTLLLGGGALLLLGITWIITRHHRRIVQRRLTELAKRKKSRNN